MSAAVSFGLAAILAGGHSPGIRQCLGRYAAGLAQNSDACRPEIGD